MPISIPVSNADSSRRWRPERLHHGGPEVDEAQALEQARAFAGLKGMDLAKVVTTSESYEWTEGTWQLPAAAGDAPDRSAPAYSVVALDFGVKRNILRILVDLGCKVTVMPAQSTIDEVMARAPDGVFFSNGPGDPEPCAYAITLARVVMDRAIPLFGICLGHPILALASGARTEKMKFGHHGANHPVQNLSDKTVMVTSQNHGFTVSEQDLPDTLEVTHRSLFDGTLQGIARKDVPAYSFQAIPKPVRDLTMRPISFSPSSRRWRKQSNEWGVLERAASI